MVTILFQNFQISLFAKLPQLLIEGEAYYGPNADDECEDNSLIQRGSEYGPHKVIRNKNVQSEKDFGCIVESNGRIIWGLSTKRVRHEFQRDAGASVENEESAYELEKGDNPADNGDPIDDVFEHMTSSWVCYQ